jgi:GAF domain-containing protein
VPSATPSETPAALAEVLTPTVRALRRLYAAQSASIALTSEDGATLRFVAADGRASERVLGLQIPSGTGIAGWVAMSQQQMAVADVTQDPRFAREVAESLGYVPTTILAAPLPGEDGALGVIEVLDPDPARRGDLGTLSLVGSLLAAVATLATEQSAAPLDPAFSSRLTRVTELGPAAADLAARLLDAVADAWDARD